MSSSYTSTHEEKRLCNEWLKDPLSNPSTGMPIDLKGPTYLFWQRRCKELGLNYKPIRSNELSYRKCQEWRRTPHVNPETGKQITVGGPLYKSIERRCKTVTEPVRAVQGKYFLPDRQGLIPAFKAENGIFYIVRHIESTTQSFAANGQSTAAVPERLVYGPLNTLTFKARTSLVYFKDTWDYRQGIYKPIFESGVEPQRPRDYAETRALRREPGACTQSVDTNPKLKVDSLVDLFVAKNEQRAPSSVTTLVNLFTRTAPQR